MNINIQGNESYEHEKNNYQYWCVWTAMQIEKKVLLQAQAILYLAPEMNYFDWGEK